MTEAIFGIDFGTTNSLAAIAVGGRALALVDRVTLRPHPSVIWYRGSDIVVGREARQNMDITESGAPPGFVRSPKMSLRRDGPIFVDGRPVEPTDAVAEVLKHLKTDASLARGSAPGHDLTRAVFTIPVDFGGPERRALREAARKAGVGVVQFVHEPVAALYAYLRSQPDLGRELARLVEIFDRNQVTFVSVTQSFNTTTSMGRLTLNILLSFAQFEREVIGERIRDKVAASRKRGMWMGGHVPLGYDVRDRKLLVNEAEAATVRMIFERFVAIGSATTLAKALAAEGVLNKRGKPIDKGFLYKLINNRVYLGEAVHKGTA